MSIQTAPSGCFRPVGSESFGKSHQNPIAFDQQPVEASATIAACIVASHADSAIEWPIAAMRAFNWFLGQNDLQVSLVDSEMGTCSDGLHPDRANENRGAESTLSYLLGLAEIRKFKRDADNRSTNNRIQGSAQNCKRIDRISNDLRGQLCLNPNS